MKRVLTNKKYVVNTRNFHIDKNLDIYNITDDAGYNILYIYDQYDGYLRLIRHIDHIKYIVVNYYITDIKSIRKEKYKELFK